MQIIAELETFPPLTNSGLTIGNFDGVHRGHLALLHHLRTLSKNAPLIVYTFLNHPTHVLTQAPKIPFIYTLEHKLKILKEQDVDYVILTTFTKEFAETPFDQFLKILKARTGFSHLVLGEEASFGKNKEGNAAQIRSLAHTLHFTVEYLPKLKGLEHLFISSGHIRTLIAEAQFSQIADYLGRPYSIYAPLHHTQGHLEMYLPQLCLPPDGLYPVCIKIADNTYLGHAHIERHSARLRIDSFAQDIPQGLLAEIIFTH